MKLFKKIFGGLALWATWAFFEIFWILLVKDLDANGIHLSTATKVVGCPVFAWVGHYFGKWWSTYITADRIIWWR